MSKIPKSLFNAIGPVTQHISDNSVPLRDLVKPIRQRPFPLIKAPKIGSENQGSGLSQFASGAMKYILGAGAAAYTYDTMANHFFLSTTALHDGKCGFTSDARLDKARPEAEENYQIYQSHPLAEQQAHNKSVNPFRLCGDNQFVTMTDYRVATRVYLSRMVDSKSAHALMSDNVQCLKGSYVKKEAVEQFNPTRLPRNFDLTQSAAYDQKNKYSLIGVRNEETGSFGYTSRSATHPFVAKGWDHFYQATRGENGVTPKQCVENLEALLERDATLGAEAQFAAGQLLLVYRQAYADEENWGNAESVVLADMYRHGLASQAEADKIELTRPPYQEDLDNGVLRRNTSCFGPILQRADIWAQEHILKKDPETIESINNPHVADLQYSPLSHFKLNLKGNGFEDCSGLGDSFTSLNATSCLNHARLMSGKERLSRDEVIVLIACLNAVYDNAGGIRHTLQEIASGCFTGAGYTNAEADDFYRRLCKNAAEMFYGGRNLKPLAQPKPPEFTSAASPAA
ncbi:XopAG/AvrGf1 family type III secretion system effector [Ralstonia pseudosolanacearum]|uniref:XopAG/AvrGf1 family type III secretion system effector n=1 Tax=Ralstonia pseudosolanacearum TaxID=1310165 RepID=UPI001E3C4477|nr:XopAG/AvrGf1 family type III secretion system effector [Ralstonia pseudosolanacearum]